MAWTDSRTLRRLLAFGRKMTNKLVMAKFFRKVSHGICHVSDFKLFVPTDPVRTHRVIKRLPEIKLSGSVQESLNRDIERVGADMYAALGDHGQR